MKGSLCDAIQSNTSWCVEKMAAYSGHFCNANALRTLVRILDDFFSITVSFLGLPRDLFAEALDLLLFAADQLSRFFLYLTGDVF
jgi:hypothetical protein